MRPIRSVIGFMPGLSTMSCSDCRSLWSTDLSVFNYNSTSKSSCAAADAASINVNLYKYVNALVGGALCGLDILGFRLQGLPKFAVSYNNYFSNSFHEEV